MTATSIKINKETAQRLAELGKKGQTYNDIIVKILNKIERKKVHRDG